MKSKLSVKSSNEVEKKKRKASEKTPRLRLEKSGGISDEKLQSVSYMLLNNAKKVEVKTPLLASKDGLDAYQPQFQYEFDLKTVEIGKAMLGTTEYTARLVRVSTVTTGAASLKVFIPTALDQYAESASFTALFDECKLQKTQFHFVASNIITGSTAFDVYIGFRNQQDRVAPTTASVARLPGMKQYMIYPGPVTVSRASIEATNLTRRARVWGVTSQDLAASSSSTITSGCLGQWEIADSGAFTVPTTTLAISYHLISVVKFRCRT